MPTILDRPYQLYDAKGAAGFLGISRATFYKHLDRWKLSGLLPSHVPPTDPRSPADRTHREYYSERDLLLLRATVKDSLPERELTAAA